LASDKDILTMKNSRSTIYQIHTLWILYDWACILRELQRAISGRITLETECSGM